MAKTLTGMRAERMAAKAKRIRREMAEIKLLRDKEAMGLLAEGVDRFSLNKKQTRGVFDRLAHLVEIGAL